ncbi:MAG: S4 domain-containing protein [Planctomycetota bacterium]|nr:S4 domain-containing protein [Planctomycetota bacterium]
MPREEGIISEINLTVSASFDGWRLDRFLAESLDEFSRSYLKKLIGDGLITLNGRLPKPAKTVRNGDEIDISIPEPVVLTAKPQDIPLSVVFEDESLIVINKPPDMVVHPAPVIPTARS